MYNVASRHLPLNMIERIFPPEILRSHDCFRFIGNHGDPIFHPRLFEIVRYFKRNGAARLLLNSNGSGRPGRWWRALAEELGPDDTVLLSIDGLEDTNAIYRVNSSWPQIMAAVKELRGRVRLGWKFIVFSYNQSQMDEARHRAEDLGFDWISFEFTNRWGPPRLPSRPDLLTLALNLSPAPDFVTDSEWRAKAVWSGRYELLPRLIFNTRDKVSYDR